MPLYEITDSSFRPITEASFQDLKVKERDDLQCFLRTEIKVLGDNLCLFIEEPGDWKDKQSCAAKEAAGEPITPPGLPLAKESRRGL